jgi:hypothetical protein
MFYLTVQEPGNTKTKASSEALSKNLPQPSLPAAVVASNPWLQSPLHLYSAFSWTLLSLAYEDGSHID